MIKRKYVVKERKDIPRTSHRSFMFPESLFTLVRDEDGRTYQVVLSRAMGWQPGDVVELEDLIVQANAS